MRFILPLCLLFAGALPSLGQIGSVVRGQKINQVSGGLVGPVPRLGQALAAIGDLNGDGVGDLVAGLPTDRAAGEFHGALLVLFMSANGTVRSQQKISEVVGGFTASLPDYAYLGLVISALGDLDSDGRQELAASTLYPPSTWILFLKVDGTVRTHREIAWDDPVFGGATLATDFLSAFYRGLVGMGDLDGDGVGDFAVGAPDDDDGDPGAGAVWIVYLNADGTAKAAKKISQGSGGFTGDLSARAFFGNSLTRLGDLNRDGFADLGVGALGGALQSQWVLFLNRNQDVLRAIHYGPVPGFDPVTEILDPIGDLDGDGLTELGSENPFRGFNVDFLAPDGHLRSRLRVRPGSNGMPDDLATRSLGGAFASLGDLDGDGTIEVAVGDAQDTESRGAIWILSLARTAVSNGTGMNQLILREKAEPVIGQTWIAKLYCSNSRHTNGMATIFGHERPLAGVFLPAGELLADITSRRVFQLFAPHASGPVSFSVVVPPKIELINLQIYVQGACSGAHGAVLSNALYVLVGR